MTETNSANNSDKLWRDQVAQFPSDEQVQVLIGLLRTPELREIAAGAITDTIAACQAGNFLEVAEAANGWIATAEETVASRRKLRHILNARESLANNS